MLLGLMVSVGASGIIGQGGRRPDPDVHAHVSLRGIRAHRENGVQILSPHYMMDPTHSKTVAPDRWYAPPAKPPGKDS
jgi:hypothetical protein